MDATPARTAAPEATIRIVVVDDHRTFAELLSLALEAESDLTCVAHAQSVAEGRLAVRRERPDVVLMDLQLPDGDGIDATAQILREDPGIRVLVLTAHPNPTEMARAGAAGASGFLAKDGALDEVLTAVRTARRGHLVLPSSVVAHFRAQSDEPGRVSPPDAGLTPRELAVLRLLAEGKDPRAVARELGISLNTCRGYIKAVLAKLGVHSQLEAVVRASRIGLLSEGYRHV
ncbi:MAG: response regulator transcription factor [Candidatus Nanopelagicales bacterium]